MNTPLYMSVTNVLGGTWDEGHNTRQVRQPANELQPPSGERKRAFNIKSSRERGSADQPRTQHQYSELFALNRLATRRAPSQNVGQELFERSRTPTKYTSEE